MSTRTAPTRGGPDGDGFDGEEVGGLDCDDADPEVRPDAVEDLDPADLDCDGHGDPTGGVLPGLRLRRLPEAAEAAEGRLGAVEQKVRIWP